MLEERSGSVGAAPTPIVSRRNSNPPRSNTKKLATESDISHCPKSLVKYSLVLSESLILVSKPSYPPFAKSSRVLFILFTIEVSPYSATLTAASVEHS